MTTLDELHFELDTVISMSEEEVCKKYNADSKSEIISLIEEDIQAYQSNPLPEDDGMDYTSLCVSQGLSTNMSFIKY